MKQTLYLFITILLSLGVLGACGQGDKVEENDTGSETEGEATDEGASGDNDMDEDSSDEDASNSESTEDTDVEQEDTVETDSDSSDEEVSETVTLYFSNNDLLETYKEEQEVQASSEEDIPAAALEAWIDGPEHEGLTTHFQDDVDVESIEEEDGVALVSFSKTFLNANVGSGAELAITEQIALIMEQFGYEETKILIEGEEEDSLFGHMDATEPITAENPEDYETIE